MLVPRKQQINTRGPIKANQGIMHAFRDPSTCSYIGGLGDCG